MALVLSPARLAVLALRRIRNVSWFEGEAEGNALAIALEHLDLIVSELGGTERLWWLQKFDQEVPVVGGQRDYDLSGILTPDPQDIIKAAWIDEFSRRDPLVLYRRADWDELDDRDIAEAAKPCGAYIEHTPQSMMRLYPTPTEDGTINLTAQVLTGSLTQTDAPMDVPASWQRYFVIALAADLGSGPIETLPVERLDRLKQEAAGLKNMLLARGRYENVELPRFVEPWDPAA